MTIHLTEAQRIERLLAGRDLKASEVARLLKAKQIANVQRTLIGMCDLGICRVVRSESVFKNGCGRKANVYGLVRRDRRTILLQKMLVIQWKGTVHRDANTASSA